MNTVTITEVKARAVLVPFSIAPKTASGSLEHAAMVLIDVHTSEGLIGHAYLFAFGQAMLAPIVATVNALAAMVKGDELAPLDLENKLRKNLRLIDTPGLIGLALNGLDMAFWDAHSKVLDQPLCKVLGSARRSVQAYNSCGLWIQNVETLADEAEQLLAAHEFKAVKLRLGRQSARRLLEHRQSTM